MDRHTAPTSVRVAALLCIASGIESVCSSVVDGFHGRLSVPVGALMLLFGKWLLSASSTSRYWVLLATGFVMLTGLIVGGMKIRETESLADYSDATVVHTVFQLTLFLAATSFVFYAMMRKDARKWFSLERTELVADSKWAMPAGIAIALILVMCTAKSEYADYRMRNSFPIATTVVLQGESPANNFRVESNAICESPTGCPTLPHLTYMTSFGSDDTITVWLTGVADAPVSVKFHLDGYHAETIRLTKTSPREISLHWTRDGSNNRSTSVSITDDNSVNKPPEDRVKKSRSP
jgi:hypothetical protein